MTLQTSGPIKLSELRTEFLTPIRTPLTAYVKEGDYVPDSGGVGYPNEDVPTIPPLAMTDFYGSARNPNPVEVSNLLLLGDTSNVEVLAASPEGLYVEPWDGLSLPIPPETQFVIEAMFSCGPTFDTPSVGDVRSFGAGAQIWQNCRLYADVLLGLTYANPLTASKNSIMSSFIGYRFQFYRDQFGSSDGVGLFRMAGDNLFWMDTGNFWQARPDSDDFARLRISRGTDIAGSSGPGDWGVKWDVEVMDDSGNVLYQDPGLGQQLAGVNIGGYPVFINNTPTGTGEIDITMEWARVYVGSDIPPW